MVPDMSGLELRASGELTDSPAAAAQVELASWVLGRLDGSTSAATWA